MKCCIDIGSNSVKYLIYDKHSNKTISQGNIHNRLISYNENHEIIIPEESIQKNIQIIQQLIDSYPLLEEQNIIIIGTMALREAKNANLFSDQVFKSFGIKINILSPTEEARYNFLSVISDFQVENQRLMLFNIGGGSVEFTFSLGETILHQESIDIGAVVLKELYFDPFTENSIIECEQFIKDKSRHLTNFQFDILMGNGGAFSSINQLLLKIDQYSYPLLHQQEIRIKEIEEIYQKIIINDPDMHNAILRYVNRSHQDIILQGIIIIFTVMQSFSKTSIRCSEKSLCHYFAER